MGKRVFCVAVFTASFLMASQARAAQWCWKLDPYLDLMKATVIVPTGPQPKPIIAYWRASSMYSQGASGTIMTSPFAPTNWEIQMGGMRTTDSHVWFFTATMDKATRNGTWGVVDVSSGFTNSGTLTLIACSTPFSPAHGISAAGR